MKNQSGNLPVFYIDDTHLENKILLCCNEFTAIRNVFNDMYARDTSKKLVVKMKMRFPAGIIQEEWFEECPICGEEDSRTK
jgi:hypothetical protein